MLRRTLWKSLSFLSVGFLLLTAFFNLPRASTPLYSDFVGVYALIDKVVLEPNDTAPERIQIWGAFANASARDRNSYDSPLRGYYYYSIPPGKGEACRKEWADFKNIAGTGRVIGFGGRGIESGRLRKAGEKAQNPDPYPVAWGLTQMSQRPGGYTPVMGLRSLPVPHSPVDGAEVKSGKVTLVAGNIADRERKNVKYIFEIKAAGSSEQEVSTPIALGDTGARWSPNMNLRAGEKYIWNVKATDGQWTGPMASSEFKVIR